MTGVPHAMERAERAHTQGNGASKTRHKISLVCHFDGLCVARLFESGGLVITILRLSREAPRDTSSGIVASPSLSWKAHTISLRKYFTSLAPPFTAAVVLPIQDRPSLSQRSERAEPAPLPYPAPSTPLLCFFLALCALWIVLVGNRPKLRKLSTANMRSYKQQRESSDRAQSSILSRAAGPKSAKMNHQLPPMNPNNSRMERCSSPSSDGKLVKRAVSPPTTSSATGALLSLSKLLTPSPSGKNNNNKRQSNPTLITMLNNKGVIYIQRRQYAQAKKSLSRALRIAEKSEPDSYFSLRRGRGRRLKSQNSQELSSSDESCGTEPTEFSESSSSLEETLIRESFPDITKIIDDSDTTCSDQCFQEDMDVPRPTTSFGEWSGAVVQTAMSSLSLFSSSRDSDSSMGGEGSSGNGTPAPFKHRAEYDEGMDYFRSPLRLEDSSQNMDTTILFNLARVHHNQGNFDEALVLYKRSLHALESCQLDENVLALAILFGIGQIQYVRGDHSDSLNTYNTALNLAKTKLGPESLEVAACMNCIGVLHYIMPKGSADVALGHLKASIRLRKQQLGDSHIDVGTTWNNVGRIYFQQAKYEKAMDAYRRALRIRRQEQGDSVDVAATIFNIGQVFHQQGERERALRHYQEFLRLAKTHFGEYHRDICIVTTCIGQVLHEKKDFKKALKAFQHALRVGRVSLGSLHPEIAITLNKLGNLHYESGDLDSALKAYHDGLEVELSVLDPGNPNICVTYTNIAEIHKQRAEYDNALDNYCKVLELQRKHCNNPLDIANTLSSIGYVRHQKGDYQGAMDVNQECLRLRREVKGDIDEDVAATLTHIALVLLKMEMHDMALEVLTEAYRIRTKLSSKENRDIAFTLYNIALIYHHQGSHERSLQFYLETARVEKAALGVAHRDLSITYYNIGQIYYQRGDMDLALENFHQALSIERECFGESHPTCARTLNEIGNINLQLGNVEAMMSAYTEALRIYREAGVNDDHLIIYGRSLWRFECVQPEAAGAA